MYGACCYCDRAGHPDQFPGFAMEAPGSGTGSIIIIIITITIIIVIIIIVIIIVIVIVIVIVIIIAALNRGAHRPRHGLVARLMQGVVRFYLWKP